MSKLGRWSWVALGVVLWGLAVPRAVAIEPMSLPAFEVANLDGEAVASTALGREGKWLLMYLAPHSDASQSLLRLLKKGTPGLAAERVVVLVGGTAEEARELRESCPPLLNASWYVDLNKDAALRLNVRGTPTVLGARDQELLWCANGTLSDPKHVESALLTWLAGTAQ